MTVTAIAPGLQTGYTIGSDGKLYAWGLGFLGQLGNGTTTFQQTTPVAVSLPTGVTAAAIAGGWSTGYAIGSDGKLYAWGEGAFGELGNGTADGQTTPVAVSLPSGVTPTAIAAGVHTRLTPSARTTSSTPGAPAPMANWVTARRRWPRPPRSRSRCPAG